jgi:F-type H+-transporting ATPase subunit epsilon
MPGRVQFELVTPERLLLSEMVEMVVIPGTEGNFGVLPGHAPLISTIRPGMIEIYEGQTVTRRVSVVSGLAEVTPVRCTVLADEAVSPDTLDRSSIESDLQTVEGNLPSLRERTARAPIRIASASRSSSIALNANNRFSRQSCRRSAR